MNRKTFLQTIGASPLLAMFTKKKKETPIEEYEEYKIPVNEGTKHYFETIHFSGYHAGGFKF